MMITFIYLIEEYLILMASRKDDKRDEPTIRSEETSPASLSQQKEIREAIVDAFEEASNNTGRALKEAKKEIPRYKEAVGNYQEKILETARGIAENYIDSQKELFDLFQQSTWMSRLGGNEYGTFLSNWMSSTTNRMTETYANTVSSYVDSLYAATRLTNNMVSANMEVLKTSMQHTKQFSRVSANNVKTFGLTAREYTESLNQLGTRETSTEKQI
jgi:hypothetical protein